MGASFEVEAVMRVQDTTYVVARLLDGMPFEVGALSYLGAAPLQASLEQPRALDPAGAPRQDIYSFALAIPGDGDFFREGRVVRLTQAGPAASGARASTADVALSASAEEARRRVEPLLEAIRVFTAGLVDHDTFERAYYALWLAADTTGLPPADYNFLQEVHERLDWTDGAPTTMERADGWWDREEYQAWLRRSLPESLFA